MPGFGSFLRGLFDVGRVPGVAAEKRADGGRVFDWMATTSHRNLLAFFLSPKVSQDDLRGEWEALLGESPRISVERFVALGMLSPRADSPGKFDCTPAGVQVGRYRLGELESLKAIAIQRSLELMRAQKTQEAFDIFSAYTRESVPDWRAGLGFALKDPDRLNTMIGFSTGRPSIFGELPETSWEAIRIAAAMDSLWGGGLKRWMLPDVDRVGRFNLTEAYVLLQCSWNHRRTLLLMRTTKLRRATIICVGDGCPACRSIADRELDVDELPELPLAACTTRRGCHCRLRPILNFEDDDDS